MDSEKHSFVPKDHLNVLSDSNLMRNKERDEEKCISAERAQNQLKESEGNNVPALHLIDSDDERSRPFKDSLDLEPTGTVTMTNGNYAKSVEMAKKEHAQEPLHSQELTNTHQSGNKAVSFNIDSLMEGNAKVSLNARDSDIKSISDHLFCSIIDSLDMTRKDLIKPDSWSYVPPPAPQHIQSTQDVPELLVFNKVVPAFWPHNTDSELTNISSPSIHTKNVRWESHGWENNEVETGNMKTKQKQVATDKTKPRPQQRPGVPSKDYVVANRTQFAKPAKKSYGQLYAKKVNKEDDANMGQENQERNEETNGNFDEYYNNNQYYQGESNEDQTFPNWNNGGHSQFNHQTGLTHGQSYPGPPTAKTAITGAEAVWQARSGSLGRRIEVGNNRRASAEVVGVGGIKKQVLAFGRGYNATKQGGSSAPNRRRPGPHGQPPSEQRAPEQQGSRALVTRRAYTQPAIHVNQVYIYIYSHLNKALIAKSGSGSI